MIRFSDEIASEMGLNEDTVERAIRNMFELVKDEMQTGEFKTIHLKYLGKWTVKPKRLEYLNQHGKKDKQTTGN